MTYSKPEVKTLGDAKMVIESTHQKVASLQTDGQLMKITNPAYDLDE
jgi:hypothetical protein